MNTFQVSDYGYDLASRPLGHKLRSALISQITHDGVELDFSGVRSITHSFADEFLAVLIEQRGEAWFKANIKVINHSQSVRSVLLDAIQYRLDGALAVA